jgi:hypothetical protein
MHLQVTAYQWEKASWARSVASTGTPLQVCACVARQIRIQHIAADWDGIGGSRDDIAACVAGSSSAGRCDAGFDPGTCISSSCRAPKLKHVVEAVGVAGCWASAGSDEGNATRECCGVVGTDRDQVATGLVGRVSAAFDDVAGCDGRRSGDSYGSGLQVGTACTGRMGQFERNSNCLSQTRHLLLPILWLPILIWNVMRCSEVVECPLCIQPAALIV